MYLQPVSRFIGRPLSIALTPVNLTPVQTPSFIGHEIFRGSSYGVHHPLRVPRVSTVTDLSRAMGWLPASQFILSPRAKPKALHAWHDADYVAALQRVERDQEIAEGDLARFGIGSTNNPVFAEIFRRPATAAGGSILAGELLANGGVVYNPAGAHTMGCLHAPTGFAI